MNDVNSLLDSVSPARGRPQCERADGAQMAGLLTGRRRGRLTDASSRPTRSPRAIEPTKALAIVELRQKRLTHARITAALGVSRSTVGRVLARAGLSILSDLAISIPSSRPYAMSTKRRVLHHQHSFLPKQWPGVGISKLSDLDPVDSVASW